MRPGRAIRAALGICLVPSLLLGCGSSPPEAEKAAAAQPKLDVPADSKPQKSKAPPKAPPRESNKPHL